MAHAKSVRALGLAWSIVLAFAAESSLTRALDAGTHKFATDAGTRASMEHIRRRVIDVHTLITHRRMPVASARQFSEDVSQDVARIAEARAAAVVDDPIAPILQQIKLGAATISDPKPERSQIDGLVDVVAALETYARTFDHPGWRPLQDQ